MVTTIFLMSILGVIFKMFIAIIIALIINVIMKKINVSENKRFFVILAVLTVFINVMIFADSYGYTKTTKAKQTNTKQKGK